MKSFRRLLVFSALLLLAGCATDDSKLRPVRPEDKKRNTFDDLTPLDERTPFGRKTTP